MGYTIAKTNIIKKIKARFHESVETSCPIHYSGGCNCSADPSKITDLHIQYYTKFDKGQSNKRNSRSITNFLHAFNRTATCGILNFLPKQLILRVHRNEPE